MRMRLHPVRTRQAPRYPTRDALNEHPEFLYTVPQRWRGNRLVLTALRGAVCLSLAGQAVAGDPAAAKAPQVAPIFVHGAGRGSFGCEVVNPPVFLSEDEARQVIQEEARKAGLEFAPGALTIPSAAIPRTHLAASSRAMGTVNGPLVLDGFDRRRNVAYEFVSAADLRAWSDGQVLSTVQYYDVIGASETLSKGLAQWNRPAWVGVFYDPAATRVNPIGRPQPGQEELRQQVRDFIRWLKAQGVI